MPLVFGIAVPALSRTARPRAEAFVAELAKRVALPMVLATPQSYDALAAMVDLHKIDVAWLPPIPLMGLEHAKLAIPLVSHSRDSSHGSRAVLVARKGSGVGTVADLVGKRVAWVDPLNASGYVLPRIELESRGIDPRAVFGNQRFYLSHDECVRAVLDDHADVAATYARLDAEGKLSRGRWARIEGADPALAIVAIFGTVPADVTAARSDVDAETRDRLTKALIAMSRDASAPLVREVFGVDEFVPYVAEDYETLRAAMADAAARGLLDASDTTGQFPASQE
jgi:phosphonate transport system substrate-binding protein